MSKVSLKDVNMNYHTVNGEIKALDNISFELSSGEFLSIVGPSGCGKSTLLNIIAGIIKPSFGEILINGKKEEKERKFLGYMFQKDHLFEWLSIFDNVILGLKIQKKISRNAIKRLEELLKEYGLYEFRDKKPSELSGGMRQRAALIRTLAFNPEVLLLDEPFSALDFQTRLNVSDDIYKIIRKEEKSVIMVTHDIEEAVSLSDRVIVLSSRPSKIKKDIKIVYEENNLTPLKRREKEELKKYSSEIWQLLEEKK